MSIPARRRASKPRTKPKKRTVHTLNAAPAREPILALDQIQGNVIPGFRKDHQRFLFFTFGDVASAHAFVRALAAEVTTAAQALEAHAEWKAQRSAFGGEPSDLGFSFVNVAFTAEGLRLLAPAAEVERFDDAAFKVGLAKRAGFLKDPIDAAGRPTGWLFGDPQRPVHLLLLLARDDRDALASDAEAWRTRAIAAGLALVHEDIGDAFAAPEKGHEHFGFRDGLSEVVLRGRRPGSRTAIYERRWPAGAAFAELRKDFASPGKPLMWPGHALFGYPRQRRDDPRSPDLAALPRGPAWAADGSFLVYRRLRQDVERFWSFVRQASTDLRARRGHAAPDPDRLAAMLVGRWKSGTPLARSPHTDLQITGEPATHFGFNSALPPLPGDPAPSADPDPDGMTTPLGAHIRKVNPRDEATDLGIAERTIPKLLLRRGITYAVSSTPVDRGLLFVAYQSSIVDQFEFLMRTWIHPPQASNAPRGGSGPDPILAGGPGQRTALWIDGVREEIDVPGGWVTATGGAYLFAPSIRFLATR
jgi:Dyp-type peroxidase family